MEFFIPVVAIVFVFTSLTLLILTPFSLRSVDRTKLHQSLHKAYEAGHELPPELIQALTVGAKPSPMRDLRIAVILLAIAGAVIAFGFSIDRMDPGELALYPFLGISAFPGFIGLGFLGLWLAGRGRAPVA